MNVVDGRQLKLGRVLLGLTMSEMADAAGLHRNSIYRVETFENLPATAYAADKITQALEKRGVKFTASKDVLGIHFDALSVREKPKYTKL